jgi:hypothetical protein
MLQFLSCFNLSMIIDDTKGLNLAPINTRIFTKVYES